MIVSRQFFTIAENGQRYSSQNRLYTRLYIRFYSVCILKESKVQHFLTSGINAITASRPSF